MNASERGEHFCGGNLGIIEVNTSCVSGATDETKFAFSGLANGVLLALLLAEQPVLLHLPLVPASSASESSYPSGLL